jgi:hypothetical protein
MPGGTSARISCCSHEADFSPITALVEPIRCFVQNLGGGHEAALFHHRRCRSGGGVAVCRAREPRDLSSQALAAAGPLMGMSGTGSTLRGCSARTTLNKELWTSRWPL